VYYNEELVTNRKFQTQLSRKLQRFRTCRKNKKCSIFHGLSEYIIFHMIITYWTGPLRELIKKNLTRMGIEPAIHNLQRHIRYPFGHQKTVSSKNVNLLPISDIQKGKFYVTQLGIEPAPPDC
jgi:hypothetical protein